LIPIFVSNLLVVSLVEVPIELVISLVFRFWRHGRTYENNHLLGQRRKMMMTTTLPLIANQTTKVKRPREGGFCVTFSFWVL
jgi:hypothetical protein